MTVAMVMTVMTYAAEVLEEYFRQGCPCLFRSLTGLYCPGCGGTRAFRYLLRGDVLRSLWYHPLVGYTAAVIVTEFGGWAIRRWEKGRRTDGRMGSGKTASRRKDIRRPDQGIREESQAGAGRFLGHYEAETYVGIGIAAVNWAVKNWALLRWGVELIP